MRAVCRTLPSGAGSVSVENVHLSGIPDTHLEWYGHHERVSSINHALLVQIGKRVQLLRKRKGWTQIDMAVALDMNRGHISDIEKGKREVGIITLQVIARGLGTTMSELLRRL
jgi:DNA-binding XRE family transcriptional regulator